MKKKISIGDIAKHLNISKTTVSFVLNGKAREKHISESLEGKVLTYIKEVGYKPNAFARGLRTGKTKIIGMLVEDISDPFFASIARMIEEEANKKGYRIIYSSTENDTERTKALIDIYRTRQVDGYIIAPPPGVEEDIRSLIHDNLPVILFDRYFPELQTNNVVVDNFQATYNAVQHFFDNGYKNVAFVTLPSEQIQMKERLNGYQQVIKERKDMAYVKKIGFHNEHSLIVSEIEEFLKENKRIDAVFFATNYLADAGLEAIRDLGLSIPNDLGVIVFDDSRLFRLFTPSITAISQPIKEISETVIKLLLSKLTSSPKISEPDTVVIPTSLIIRNSSRPVSIEV